MSLILSTAVLAAQAATPCEARFPAAETVVYAAHAGGFDPFAAETPLEEARIALADVSADCALVLTVYDQSLPTGAPRFTLRKSGEVGLALELFEDAAARLPVTNLETPGAIGAYRLPDGAREAEIFFRPVTSPDARLSAGNYAANLTLRLFTAGAGESRLLDETTLSVEAPVATIRDVRIALTETPFDTAHGTATLDFGALETGETGAAFLSVRSTERYSLSLESDQDWALASEDGGRVPYALSIDDRRLALADNPERLNRAGAPTGAEGAPHRIDVTIGETGGQPAGEYEDAILIRVTPVD